MLREAWPSGYCTRIGTAQRRVLYKQRVKIGKQERETAAAFRNRVVATVVGTADGTLWHTRAPPLGRPRPKTTANGGCMPSYCPTAVLPLPGPCTR